MLGTTNAATGSAIQDLTIQINGSNVLTYNGESVKNLDITLASLGAAASDHNHDTVYSSLNHTHTKAQIGLGSVNNTADNTKNVYSAYYVRGEYTGNGGKQPPSSVPNCGTRFIMSNETGYFADWIYMDNYLGNDVPYVSAIGLEKMATPTLWIMSGPKKGNSWTMKRRIPALTTDPISGQILIASDNVGGVKTSGYTPASFSASNHNHDSAYSSLYHEHTNLNIFRFDRDARTTGTRPDQYDGKMFLVGLKHLSAIGITTGSGDYAGVIGMRQWADASGGQAHEIAVSDNNSIWSRSGSTTSWGAWSLICCTNSKAVICQSSSPCISGMWVW